MHLRAEDSGEYTLRAINRWGEIISTSTLNVIGQYLTHLLNNHSLIALLSSFGVFVHRRYCEFNFPNCSCDFAICNALSLFLFLCYN